MFTFIDNLGDLDFLNQELLTKDFVGVDTEFRRTTKENMKLALLQVNDGEETYLIDTISIKEPCESSSFLYSPSVTKILHSCKEDLEAVFSWTNEFMVNIFDTQLANSLLGKDYSIGYQALVEQELGIILEKNETRSNWLRRPLTDSQLKYAALDVEYLLHLYSEQKEEMSKTAKLEWHNQDIVKLIDNTFYSDPAQRDFSRVLPREEENILLIKFHSIIEKVALEQKINSTLFFSKKSQKDFLRLALSEGMEVALNNLTLWRRSLIRDDLRDLLA